MTAAPRETGTADRVQTANPWPATRPVPYSNDKPPPMPLIRLQNIHLGYGHPPLLDSVSLAIEEGERIALVGRNGAGKSTLLRILSGELAPDDGEVVRWQGLRVARLEQEVPRDLEGSVYDVVAAGLGELGALITGYHHAAGELHRADGLARLERLHARIDAAGGWAVEQRIESVLSRLQLPPDAEMASLSGGYKRRGLLARALVQEPHLLLLDEPSNHLDIESIQWLESFLAMAEPALLFITHDRAFLRRLATRIVEIDRGRLTSWPGDYDAYLRGRQALLEAEARQEAEFDRKLAREEAWIRQGIKARRTRNEGRVRALQRMRAERAARRSGPGRVKMDANVREASGKIVIEAEKVTFAWDGKPVVKEFSATVLRGDRIGIIGPNGAGKSTLLELLLGKLRPQTGQVKHGTKLEIAYFDQLRAGLDPGQTAQDNVGGGSDTITVNGRQKHVLSYLQDFLFSPERARAPIDRLSGGETSRLLLARLFARPSNLLVLDEPTNDLDIETLELLEELLANYPGTVLLVSHDRDFLDNVVTSTLVFEGGGVVKEYVGGYSDWLRQRPAETGTPQPVKKKRPAGPAAQPARKLSYKLQRELDALPARIEELEAAQALLHERMAEPDFYRRPGNEVADAWRELAAVEAELAAAYSRWEELEGA